MTNRFLIHSVLIASLFISFSGCSEDPDYQQARQAGRQASEAMEVLINKGDIETAKSQIDGAVNSRTKGLDRDSILLVSANVGLREARSKAADLDLMTAQPRKELGQIQQQIRRIQDIDIQLKGVSRLVASGEEEIRELRQVLDSGTESLPGLRSQLAKATAELAELESERSRILEQAEQTEKQLQSLQQQADEQFESAKSASGQKRAELEQKGYDLLGQKKEPYFQKQNFLNELKIVDDRIALVKPAAERLETSIKEAEARIQSLENSEELSRLRSLQNELNVAQVKEQGVLRELAGSLLKSVNRVRSEAQETLKLLEDVKDLHEKIGSAETGPIVAYLKGQALSLAASVCSSRLRFESSVSLSMEQILNSLDQDSPLRPILQSAFLTVSEEELFTTAVNYYDEADKAFEEALSGRDPGGDFDLNVTKSRLLALHAKMKLADYLDRYDAAEQTQNRIEEIVQKTVEQHPSFRSSETARILQQGLSYTPKMQYDSELFFEGIREKLTAWRRLRGEQRKIAGQQTLMMIETLEADADEKLLKLLAPEKKALLDAQSKDFADVEAVEVTAPGEPNSL